MEALWPFLFFAVIAAVFFSIARKHFAKLRKEFPEWAAGLGWTAQPMKSWTTTPEAHGDYAGRRGRAYIYTTGSGKSRQSWSAIELLAAGTPRLELVFKRQGFGTKIEGWFGAKEVEVGDAAFDAKWFIQTNRPDFVRAALLPEVRARIEELGARGGRQMRLDFKAGRATYAEQGHFQAATRERLAAALPVLADMAALAEVEVG
jgi:hypothetical protein